MCLDTDLVASIEAMTSFQGAAFFQAIRIYVRWRTLIPASTKSITYTRRFLALPSGEISGRNFLSANPTTIAPGGAATSGIHELGAAAKSLLLSFRRGAEESAFCSQLRSPRPCCSLKNGSVSLTVRSADPLLT
jgi:hypothetical protein